MTTYEKPTLNGIERLTGHKREGDETNWHVFFSDRNEDGGPWWLNAQWMFHPTIKGYYLGPTAKGWWSLGKKTLDWGELGLALGGEDSMLQFDLMVPKVFAWHIGVRIPRQWVDKVVYERRTLSIRPGYIGHLAWVDVLYDETAGNMRDYYAREKREHTPTRTALWPGWQVKIDVRWRDRLLGKSEYTSTDVTQVVERNKGLRNLKVPRGGMVLGIPAVVPMPEGNYPCVVTFTEDVWQRKRLPWRSRMVRRAEVQMLVPIPFPGKGENSWDMDDDALYALSTPGTSVARATAKAASSVLSSRERHASRDWRPARGWPVGLRGAR